MAVTMTQPQKKSRRQMLEEIVAAKPNDSFARYGLALECVKEGDAAAADQHFQALLSATPDYVPGYLMYGQFLATAGRTEEARGRLRSGIAMAERVGDQHARSEMETALGELG